MLHDNDLINIRVSLNVTIEHTQPLGLPRRSSLIKYYILCLFPNKLYLRLKVDEFKCHTALFFYFIWPFSMLDCSFYAELCWK